jgi:hypothetical protein
MSESQQASITTASVDQAEFVEFLRAGEVATGAFECVGCRYGAVVRKELPSCPMCRGTLWERSAWAPFGTAVSGLAERLTSTPR